MGDWGEMMVIKVAVSGSRRSRFENPICGKLATYWILARNILPLTGQDSVIVGHGASPAGGVDEWTAEFCSMCGLPMVSFKPDGYTREAFLCRNRELVRWADRVICIFAEEFYSRGGTYSVYHYAKKCGKLTSAYVVDTVNCQITKVFPMREVVLSWCKNRKTLNTSLR